MIWLVPVAAGALFLGVVATAEPHPSPLVGRQAMVRRRGRAPIRQCDHFPWLVEDVDRVMAGLLELRPRTTAEDLTLTALEEVYPHTPAGEPVAWPAAPDDCLPLKAIQARVLVRARVHHAIEQDRLADDAWYESGGR